MNEKNSKIKLKNLKVWSLLFLNFAFCSLLFAFADTAFAVSGGEEGGHGFGSPMEWVWRLLNFGILLFVLIKFAGKPLKEYLQSRKELIEKSIKEAQEAKELARKALAEVEERLRLKDKEIEEIKAAALRSGESEKQRLIEEGERLKVKILEQAKTNIDYELKRAKDTIRAEAVEAAMQLAEDKIKNKLTKEDQEKLLQESLTLISKK